MTKQQTKASLMTALELSYSDVASHKRQIDELKDRLRRANRERDEAKGQLEVSRNRLREVRHQLEFLRVSSFEGCEWKRPETWENGLMVVTPDPVDGFSIFRALWQAAHR